MSRKRFALRFGPASDGDCPFPVVGEDGEAEEYVELEDAPLFDTEEEARATLDRVLTAYGKDSAEDMEIVVVKPTTVLAWSSLAAATA